MAINLNLHYRPINCQRCGTFCPTAQTVINHTCVSRAEAEAQDRAFFRATVAGK